MRAYATPSELRAYSDAAAGISDERAEPLLSMASAAIDAVCDSDDVDPDVLKLVCIRMVSRQVQNDDVAGVQQESWGASPYSGSVSYANPAGDIYLTAFEKQLLGIDGTAVEASCVNQYPASWGDE